MKSRPPGKLRKKIKRATELKRRRRLQKRTSQWSHRLELTGGASGLIATAGAPLLRLLAEESELRAGLSKSLTRPGFFPGHDRGQVLIDVAVALALGATSVAGAVDVLRQSQAALQTVASTPTAWRALEELDATAQAKIAKVRAGHRRAIWTRLAARPGGFPWVQVAGQVWQGWIVLDVDASLVESHSDKEGAAPTYKKHTAPRKRFVIFPVQLGGIRRDIPGSNGLLGSERTTGDNSMPVKQRPCPGTRNGVLRDPSDMVNS